MGVAMFVLVVWMVPCVSSHGGIVWPPIWQDGVHTPLEERWDHLAFSVPQVRDPNTGRRIRSVKSWLTDQAYTGGQGDQFLGVGEVGQINNRNVRPMDKCTRKCREQRHPWAFPGKAPSLGGGCGIFGGNPFGCPNYNDSRPPGSICGQDPPIGRGKRGTLSFGSSALDIEFPEAAVTSWSLGSVQEVTWISKGGHRGGYTYRLCKLPPQGKAGLTEECFAQNVLEFANSYTMIRESGQQHLGEWTKFQQEDRVNGTFPEGSVWRPVGVTGEGTGGVGLFRKDEVLVPSDLPEGDYVLSMRWDAAGAAQIWVSCAFVKLEPDYTADDYQELEHQIFDP